MHVERGHHGACSQCGENVSFLDHAGEVTVLNAKIAVHGTAMFVTRHCCPGVKLVDKLPRPASILDYLHTCGEDGATVEDIKRAVFGRMREVTGTTLVTVLTVLAMNGQVKAIEGRSYATHTIWIKV